VTALADRLVLRAAQPDDLPQIGALLTARGEAADAEDHALVVADPDGGWRSCAVVADGARIVSTLTLLDEELRVAVPGTDDVLALPAGQVELVATDPQYEGRGLVRALMGWAHELSAQRGHVVQLMVGIPYFYRLFGYSYAIDVQPDRPVPAPPPAADGLTVRVAGAEDLPALGALQDKAQARADVRMPHSAACWRWLHARSASELWAVELDGRVVATGRTHLSDDGGELSEVAAVDVPAAAALVAHCAGRLDGEPLAVADRPGTPVSALLDEIAEPSTPHGIQRYYVRIPDAAQLFDVLRPVFDARLAAFGGDVPDEIVLSFFGSHLRLPVTDRQLGRPVPGGTMQAPYSAGGAGIAPDALPEVLFGPDGISGLRRPDVYPGPHRELMAALFPPQTADVLTFYR
jgi:predicted N-acetyltransferase YhbS